MDNARLIVRLLREAGIARAFGIPSGNVLPLLEAMRLEGMDFVLTAHEGSAAFAADVTGRLTGVPGLCIATLGPGATNLTTGVGSAFLDRSPLIAITCTVATAQLGRRVQMHIDHHALFTPITKASLAVRADNVEAVVRDAIRIALEEPRGPVHLDVPEDVLVAEAVGATAAQAVTRASTLAASRPGASRPEASRPAASRPAASRPAVSARASEAAIEAAARLVADARRPVAVIGAAAMRMADPGRLCELVESLEVPFATTMMAKGLIDDDHPLALGCIERARRQAQRQYLQGCDLVIGLGYDTVEVEVEAWIGDVPFLAVDVEAPDVAASVRVAGLLIGDLDDALPRLAEAVGVAGSEGAGARGAAARPSRVAEVAAHGAALQASLRPAGRGFLPHQVIDVCRDLLPRDGILAFDVGAHTHQIASQWPAHEPGTFLITNGWSSMGFGLPAAIAAGLEARDRPVLCIIGDGCFQMTCGELATARRAGLTLPIVVIDDGWLSLIGVKQRRRGFATWGSRLSPSAEDGAQAAEAGLAAEPDFDGHPEPPAHYFGVPAVGVRSASELRVALAAALRVPGPTVIQALVDPAAYLETVFD